MSAMSKSMRGFEGSLGCVLRRVTATPAIAPPAITAWDSAIAPFRPGDTAQASLQQGLSAFASPVNSTPAVSGHIPENRIQY